MEPYLPLRGQRETTTVGDKSSPSEENLRHQLQIMTDHTHITNVGNSLFDASQYAFFGNEVVEEVELGGLDEDEDTSSAGIEEEYQFKPEELNKAVDVSRGGGLIGDKESRQSSSVAEWNQDIDYSTWYKQPQFNTEDGVEGNRWPSQPYATHALIADSKSLHRTSSYPEPHPQAQFLPHCLQNISSEPMAISRSSFPSYPPPGRPHMILPNKIAQLPNSQYLGGPQMGLHSQPPLSGSMSGLTHGTHFGTNMRNFSPSGHLSENHPSNQWLSCRNVVNNMLPSHGPHQDGLVPSQLMGQQQKPHHPIQYRLPHPGHSHGHLTGMHNQLYAPQQTSSPPLLNKFDAMMGIQDMRDQRPNSSQNNRQNLLYPQHGFDPNSSRGNGGWSVYRSKYMTSNEIENILRMQLAATHSNDPYVEDYYHQACLFKRTDGASLRHHFCPIQVKDLPSRARPTDDPHPFLKVDALGRIPFASIRRPKPLLEVDPLTSTNSSNSEQKILDKPLDEEPMLAARVTIEECLCLLLDVDDVDRILQFNQLPDNGAELRERRQNQLELLAASLHLVDPLVNGGPTPTDDFVFVRIASLAKGRKLLTKYLSMLSPRSELLRVISMAIFRHLRFFFGVLPADPAISWETANLVKVILSCVSGMDLNMLSSCLAAVVCSSEQPPLRPIGSSNGDDASIVLKSILDRAAKLVNDPSTNQAFWKASFDEFFTLLLKYCFSKYESNVVGSNAAIAIKNEMPVELLQASIPHINDHQRKLLMDLSQKSVPTAGSANHGDIGCLDG